ncbi:MAG: tRNA (adenosine(37)-N6)-threonylcarbamoyltransferase complex dimerization subunit type 1 TsaB [Candidatus Kinetoplastibacterium crithidii]|nr:MAG: tRNA (adenosine(37)-N6)-threonylcarbamoyltransferase complex dimerization subunit type 1 TsaB [Candidatus Kinetoplastibacterium crithidii]
MNNKIINLLAIESSTEICSVSIIFFDLDGVIKDIISSKIPKERLPSEYIIPVIESILSETKLDKSELDAVSFDQGPGKFTGIRLSCSIAKSIGMFLKIPIIPIISLYSMAFQAQIESSNAYNIIISSIDARMNEVYIGVYLIDSFTSSNCKTLFEPALISVHDLSLWLTFHVNQWKSIYKKTNIILVGDSWRIYESALRIPKGVIHSDITNPSSDILALISKNYFLDKEKKFNDIEPVYIRNKVAFTKNELLYNNGGNPKTSSFLSEIHLSKMTISDINDVMLLDAKVQLVPWSYGNFQDCLNVGYISYVAKYKESILGFFVMMIAPDVVHLLRIAVHEDVQNIGIGSKLLDRCIQISKENRLNSIIIEVGEHNINAMNFYKKYGFSKIGKREKYYVLHNSKTESAIVMEKKLC